MTRLLLCVGLALGCFSWAARCAELTVFAAASLTNAVEEIGARYQRSTGQALRFSFAASSALARQIEAGAPADVFISADQRWMDYLAERKLIVLTSRQVLLENRLALITPLDGPHQVAIRPRFDLAKLLGDGRLATGDPDHVPVGRYAREALAKLGVWPLAQARLVRADSVRAALALVERGEVPAGVVYTTDAALSTKVRIAGVFPRNAHTPIIYPMAIVAGHDTRAARDVVGFLSGDEAKAVYRRYGFVVQ